MRECEHDDANFNTPVPQSHLNTNESQETREGKWIIGHKVNILLLTFVVDISLKLTFLYKL